jgi:hypothetical protein
MLVMEMESDQIAQKAFEIWEREGRPQGRDQEHWFEAENEIRRNGAKSPAAAKTNSSQPPATKTGRTKKN